MPTHRTVLVIADSNQGNNGYEQQLQQDRSVTYRVLSQRYNALRLPLSQSQQIDGILLEFCPRSNCITLLRQLKEQMGEHCPPIVVIDDGDTEVAVQAFKSGAADYLVRDRVTPDNLRLAMRSAIENAELRRKLQQSQDLFQTSVENMLDCFGIFSAIRDESGQILDFRIDYLNAAACENNQMPQAMQVGRGLCEVLPAHRESGLFDEYCRLVKTGEPLIKDSLIYDDLYGAGRLLRAFDIRAAKLNDGFVASWRDITDRKQMEVELNQRVTELQTLLEILPVGVAIANDPACTQMQSNAYLRRLLGVATGNNISKSAPTPEQPPYRTFRDGQEILAENLPMQLAGRLGEEVRDVEFDILLPDGTLRQLLCYATPLRSDQNQIGGVIGAFLDITERHRDAVALKASQQRYRELAEAMPQMIWTADASGVITYRNQRWYEYTGMSEAASIGVAVADAVHPDERDRVLALWREAIAKGESFETECRFRGWDDEYQWFICRAIPTRADQGQITGWIGTITNIDNQKQLESRLLNEIVNHQRTEARLSLAQLAADAGHWSWDIVTNTLFWSAEYYTLYGLDPAVSATYENWLTSILEVDRERVNQEVHTALASKQSEVNIEFRIDHPVRGVRWLVTKGQTRFNPDGQPLDMSGVTFDITDRKRIKHERRQTEIALQQSQERLELAMEAAQMGSWDWDIQTGKVHWSTNLERLFGMAPGSFDGQYDTVKAMIHPDDLPLVEQATRRAIYEREDYNIEFRFIKLDGTVRWAMGLGRVFYDASGSPVTMTGVDMDISGRKQAEANLRASEARFRQMADNSPMMIWVTDATGYCTYLSQRWYDFTGQAEATGLGFAWLEAVHPDDRESSRTTFLKATERQTAFQLEYRLRRDDGEYRWAIDAASPRMGQDGEFEGFIGSVIDIHDRKQAELALQEAHIQLEAALTAGEIYTWRWNITEDVLTGDRNFAHLFGVDPEQAAAGLPLDTFLGGIHPEDRPRIAARVEQAIATGENYTEEYRVYNADGEERCVIARGRVEYDANGNAIAFPGALADITERRKAEEALRFSEERYRTLFESMDEGFCVIEMLFDDSGKPVDHRFLETNPAFERQSGLVNVQGKRMRELIPNHEEHWFEIYGRVAQTGTPIRFENRAEALQRWYDLYAFRIGQPGSQKVAVLFTNISERKRTEQELQESEARFRTLADNISQFAWMTNEKGEVVWYNRRWFDYTGTTLEEMQGWGWQKVHHPEHVDRVVNKFRRCIEAGELWEDTFPLRDKDGEYRWFLSRAIPIRDEQGRVLRWFGTNTDITELRQTQIELQRTTEQLNLALKSAPLTLFTQDLDLRYTWIYNPIQSLSMEEMIGQRDEDLISAETAARLTELKQQVLETGTSLREEVKVATAERTAYYDLTVDPIRDGQNAIVGVSCAAVDITDRTLAEEALRESEDRLRIAIETAQMGTWDFNPTTGILRWDDQCKATFGMSPTAEVNYDVFLAGLHPDDRDRTHQVVLQSFDPETGGEYDIEYRTIGLEDGIERWVAARGKAFFNSAGEAIRFIGTVLNITEKKRAEAEREQLLRREQTARAEAERANRVKDEFLAVLSHELRSPLNPILGWTKLLQSRKLDAARTAEALSTIERNAKLQTQLIDDLLDVAKILRGKLSLNMASVNLAFVIEAAIGTVGTAAGAKSISLHPVLPNIGQVFGDAARLQQIVWNLLSNAIKFTSDGGRVDIQLQQVGTQAHIIVRDTGKGISPDFLPHIFESFQQEDTSITRKYGGLGLGLAIVRQLVEAHGGAITADSPGEGLGATFTVQLPLLSIAPAIQPLNKYPQQELDLTGIRVLAVDDEPDARELLTVLLTQYGAEVLTVASASEVLANLDSFQPAVLVSDIAMPEIDGYALIQQVRALPSTRGGQIPAIALTAYAREDDYRRAISSGFQHHVTKPLEPERLVQAVLALTYSKLNRSIN